jgi:hypothetical protein
VQDTDGGFSRKSLIILRDRHPLDTIIICSLYHEILLPAVIPKYLTEDVIVAQISFTFEFINVQCFVGSKQLNSMDAFRGLAAKAKDIFIQCSEKVSTNTLMN